MSRHHAPLAWAAALGAACLATAMPLRAQDANGVCRVTTDGTSSNDGISWAQSMDLRSALADTACGEVWVAAGVYKPSATGDREASFDIRSGSVVYGGFAGTESNREQRDLTTLRSVLSGDIDDNDDIDAHGVTANAGDIVGENSLHVVRFAGDTASDTVLDGFTLTGGFANGDPEQMTDSGGGGAYCVGDGAGQACSPSLRNLVLRGNGASLGGGLLCLGINGGACDARLGNSAFIGNLAGNGGGMLSAAMLDGQSNATLENVTFGGNAAKGNGGGFSGLAAANGHVNPVLRNVTFSANAAGIAADISVGLVDDGSGATIDTILMEAILSGDIVTANGTLHVERSILQGGCPFAWGVTCIDLINGDPQLGALQDDGTMPLFLPGTGSAALDAIDCDDAPADDQRGVARPQGAACDVGAVEVRQSKLTVSVTGGGTITATGAPIPLGAPISACGATSGTCSAHYPGEPDLPVVTLALHADAGNIVQSASGCGGTLGAGGFSYVTGALDGDCTVSVVFGPPAHTIGGTVTGLVGSGLELALNGDETLPIAADGRFTFATTTQSGDAYAVSIVTQPGAPTQDCAVVNGSGTVGNADITNVVIHCGAAATYSVGGTLGGLATGTSITLLINGGDALTLAANGSFAFSPRFAPGDGYLVQIASQPDGQHCELQNGEGTVGTADVTGIAVNCQAGGANLQLGLTGESDFARYGQVRKYIVTLSNNGNGTASNVAIGANLSAAFDAPSVQWTCISGAPGATCTAQGEGGFADTATLPPGTSLTWIVRAPISGDSPADAATFTAHADGAMDASDTDTLVIFRDGFDVPYGDGANATEPAPR